MYDKVSITILEEEISKCQTVLAIPPRDHATDAGYAAIQKYYTQRLADLQAQRTHLEQAYIVNNRAS